MPTSQVVHPLKSFPPHWSQCLALQPDEPPPAADVVVGRVVVDVRVVLGGLVVVCRAEVVVRANVVLAVVVGRGFPGAHGFVPPPGFVTVVAELPSQYPTHPSKFMFLNTVLNPVIPTC